MKPQQVIVAGEVFVDLILSGCSGWPEPGKEIFAEGFRRELGGGTAITACGLAKLGVSVGVLAVVGNEWGDWLLNGLRERGVQTDLLYKDASEPTAFTVIATMPHERAFLTYPGANRGLNGRVNETVTTGALRGAQHVHFAYAPPPDSAEQLFDEVHANGCTLSLDVGWREQWVNSRESMKLLRKVDLFFPNHLEAEHISGQREPEEVLQAFRSAGIRRVALKLGAKGAALLWEGETMFLPALAVDPLDTTGAGDCFDAGFLYGLVRGESPHTCLRMANVCGALSTTRYGGIDGFPTLKRLSEEMNKLHL